MCGRFVLATPLSRIARDHFGMHAPLKDPGASFNITPGRPIPLVTRPVAGARAEIWFSWWGFRPSGITDGKAPVPINARAEAIAESRYFGYAFAHRRGLVPADGWYEWRKTDKGKQPWYISRRDGEPLFLAAVWAPRGEAGGNGAETCCAIITEPAAAALTEIHHRMPVALDRACHGAWLNPAISERMAVRAVTRRLDPELLRAWPVSSRVNAPANDGPELIDPLTFR